MLTILLETMEIGTLTIVSLPSRKQELFYRRFSDSPNEHFYPSTPDRLTHILDHPLQALLSRPLLISPRREIWMIDIPFEGRPPEDVRPVCSCLWTSGHVHSATSLPEHKVRGGFDTGQVGRSRGWSRGRGRETHGGQVFGV